MKRFTLFAALALSTVACKGKPPKSAIAWEQKVPYRQGTVFSHVPASCVGGWLYVDLQAALRNEATATSAQGFVARVAADFGKPRVRKALSSAFAEQGFDPLRDTKEIAVCYRGDEPTVIVIGGDFSGKDLFGAVRKAAEETGDTPPSVETVHGVPTLFTGKLGMSRVAPNVIAMSDDVAASARLASPFDRTAAWGWQPGRIFVAAMSGTEELRLALVESGQDIELLATQRTKKSQPELERVRDRVAKRLEDTPLKLLANTALATKIDVAAGQATYTVRAKTALVADAVRVIADLPPGELKRILAYLLAPESNEQKI